jgi:hypothetical protein
MSTTASMATIAVTQAPAQIVVHLRLTWPPMTLVRLVRMTSGTSGPYHAVPSARRDTAAAAADTSECWLDDSGPRSVPGTETRVRIQEEMTDASHPSAGDCLALINLRSTQPRRQPRDLRQDAGR